MREYAELVKRLKQSDDNCNAEHNECPAECDCPGYTIFLEAADAIEELEAAVPKWISVENEKNRPACGERVNLTDGIAVFEGFLSISGKWMISFGEFAATHWMPLPEPPKEENKR